MHVPIDDQDARQAVGLAGVLGGQGDVVEQAEAHAARRRGVMARRPDQAQGVAVLAAEHRIHGGRAGAGRRQGDRERLRADHGVAVEMAAALLAAALGEFHLSGVVQPLHFVFRHRLICRRERTGPRRPTSPAGRRRRAGGRAVRDAARSRGGGTAGRCRAGSCRNCSRLRRPGRPYFTSITYTSEPPSRLEMNAIFLPSGDHAAKLSWAGHARQVALVRAVGVHDVDLVIAVAVGREGDALAVRRPGRPVVDAVVVGQAADVAAVGVHDVNLQVADAAAAKGDLLAVGRPGRDCCRAPGRWSGAGRPCPPGPSCKFPGCRRAC